WVAACSLRIELREREALRERFAQIPLRVIGAAEVRAGSVAPAHHELAGLEACTLVRIEAREIRPAMRGHEQPAAGAQHAPELVPPRELQVRGQMREDRQCVNEVEAPVC